MKLRDAYERLVARYEATKVVPLDVLGDEAGISANQEDVEQLIAELERAGFVVGENGAASPTAVLKRYIDAAAALRTELGRAPREAEVADRASLSESDLRVVRVYVRVLGGR